MGDPARPWDTWTLVLASLPADTTTEQEASALAAEIVGTGYLRSDDYPSLNPGYWVVYLGTYETRRAAAVWCPDDLPEHLTCYPRYLGPGSSAASALALVDADLVELDPATGEVIRTIESGFSGDGVHRGGLALTPDRSRLYFAEGYEDFWFGCESSRGMIGRVDLGTLTWEILWSGFPPAVSPDGSLVAYLDASRCLPDPAEPEFVLTPADTVTVVDLAGVGRVSTPSLPAPTTDEHPSALGWLGWHPEGSLLVLDAGGTLYRSPPGRPMRCRRTPWPSPGCRDTRRGWRAAGCS